MGESITRDDLNALETRLMERSHNDLNALETRLIERSHNDLNALETRLIERSHNDLNALETKLLEQSHNDLSALETRLLERIEKTETTLLREFRKWALSFESRFRANEILVGGFNERVIALEERVGDIERRIE
jgi:hypothetical protein